MNGHRCAGTRYRCGLHLLHAGQQCATGRCPAGRDRSLHPYRHHLDPRHICRRAPRWDRPPNIPLATTACRKRPSRPTSWHALAADFPVTYSPSPAISWVPAVPLNPAGHFNPAVFRAIARGEQLLLPNYGMETVHHVHADDIAPAGWRAIDSRRAALGGQLRRV